MNKNILTTPLFGLGDALLTIPVLKLIKKYYPNYKITYFTFNKTVYEIFLNNPYIDTLLYYPILKKGKLNSLLYILRNFAFKFEIVINFYPSNRKDYNLFAFFTFAHKRIGHKYNKSNFKELNWLKNYTLKEDDNLHCVEENIRLLKFLDISIDNENIPEPEIFLTTDEITNGKNFIEKKRSSGSKNIGIHAGSSLFKNHKFRRWPKEYFLEIINYFEYYNFFLFGTNEEKEENQYILSNAKKRNVILVENKSIREVAAIIKNLDLFISNDSGLMHLAAILKTKTIGIFGPTNPKWVRPWGKENVYIKANLKCSPCFYYSPKPLNCINDNKWECLKSIKPHTLIEKIKKLC